MDDGRVLVLGVGNTLMRDDGVGVHAVRALADAYEIPANVRVIDGGTAGFRLLGDIADVDHLLIVDALKRGAFRARSIVSPQKRSVPAAALLSRPMRSGLRSF